jgi:hypothetical protein
MDFIVSDVTKANEASGLSIAFVEDGSKAFARFRHTYGLFGNVRSLLLMKGPKDLANLKEKIGYYGEDILLDCVDRGLGTCWVGGTFDKDAFAIPETETLIAVILVGIIDKPKFKDKVLIKVNHMRRKPLSDRIVFDKMLPTWVKEGMEAVVLAPSALNKQKPHLSYRNDVLRIEVPDDNATDLIDLGIAKRHFEIGAGNGHFDIGNNAVYHLDKKDM